MPDPMHPPPREAPANRGRLVALPTREPGDPPKKNNNLPLALSSFIGREKELAEVEKPLADHRLATLCGPGGCGKTRLALAVAKDLVEGFEDGAWWVGLASLSDPDLVPRAVAQALGVREAPGRPLTETLVEHLGSKRMLIVLDNCEHLIDACAELADVLLRSCPTVRILATSREALGIAGESAWLAPSLFLPDPEHPPPVEELTRYEAIRLFTKRANAVAPRFELAEQDASVVTRLCYRLDGMPLAIELARVRVCCRWGRSRSARGTVSACWRAVLARRQARGFHGGVGGGAGDAAGRGRRLRARAVANAGGAGFFPDDGLPRRPERAGGRFC